MYDVTTVIVNYNPNWDKLIKTINSVICQTNVKLQIVIADDGSKNNYFEELKRFFAENKFEDYKLVGAEKNEGTVKNFYKGILASDGEYIRGLSADDFFVQDNVLSNWINALRKSQKRWSISEVYYYNRDENDNIHYLEVYEHPQIIKPYINGNEELCRWYYLAANDNALGTKMLAEKQLYIEYLSKIVDKVIYAEDHIWRIMMFDGITPLYYPCNTVFYEYGSGISTSGNEIWKKRLKKDWDEADKIIFQQEAKTSLQRKMIKALRCKTRLSRILFMPYKFRYLNYVFNCRFKTRMSKDA